MVELELVVGAALPELDEGDVAVVELALDDVAAAVDDADDFEDVVWLPDPHAATSSAVISAAAVRFTIV